MQEKPIIKEGYYYALPKELIANKPASPRDSARLLIYDRATKTITHDIFRNCGMYLPKHSVLVMNQTKVLPARLALKKESGGLVKILYVGTHKTYMRALANKNLKPEEILKLTDQIVFTVKSREQGANKYLLKPSFSLEHIHAILEQYGEMPIPPYIKDTPLSKKELKEKYQTVFAKKEGSIAAPTASLHFTNRLMTNLKKEGIDMQFVTLHVGLGTFASVTEEQIKEKKLHEEWYEIGKITAKTLNAAKAKGYPIIPVGTTALRALESATTSEGKLEKLSGVTNLFIQEGYQFKFAGGMITNFHVPESSLMMLVAALIGREELLRIYKEAIEKQYRFFSFGDAMMII